MTMVDTFVPTGFSCGASFFDNQALPYGQHTATVHTISNGSLSVTGFTYVYMLISLESLLKF